MTMQSFVWPLDPTGVSPANLIPAEIHNLSPVNGEDFYFFIPDAAPYHENSMRITHVASGRILTKNVDWVPSHYFEAASNSYENMPIYGSCTILDRALSGAFRIDYQTLGGEFTMDEQAILEILQNASTDPRTTHWDVVTNKPAVYDPNAHLHHVTDTGSYEAMVAAFNGIAQALRDTHAQAMDIFNQHILDKNNPHQTNLVKLGIERFANVHKATLEQLMEGTNNVNFVTCLLVRAAIDAALEQYTPELPDFTADMFGLGNVPNWLIAQQVDLDTPNGERFVDPVQVYYMINKVVSTLPLGQLQGLLDKVEQHIADKDNPHLLTLAQLLIPKAINMVGNVGEIAYYDGLGGPFSMQADGVVNKLAIVHNAAELTTQQATTESFADAFSTWRRIAMSGNNPAATPSELNGWSYNAGTDRVTTTINSSTLIGLVSPDKINGDYVFEVEMSSTGADDDFIGILLGLGTYDGKLRNLVAMVDRGGINEEGIPNSTSKLVVKYDYLGDQVRTLAATNANMTHVAGGWNAISATGPIKLRAVRTGAVLVASVSNPGTNYVTSVTVDLGDAEDTDIFTGSVNLGYVAFSQQNSSWKTLRRTGSSPTIASIFNNEVWEHNGTAYVQATGKTLLDVIKPGRLYRNPTTGRLYHAPSAGGVTLLSADSSKYDTTSPNSVNTKLALVDSTGEMHVGLKVTFWHQNPSTGVMTKRGTISKADNDNGSWDYTAPDVTSNVALYLGNGDGRKGGIAATDTGLVGLVKPNGSWYGYFQPDGIFQHYGMNNISDVTVKDVRGTLDLDEEAVDELELIEWLWKADERIPEYLHGKKDSGVTAQQIQRAFPNCVSVSAETELLTVDQGKAALHLALRLLKRIQALENKE